MAKTSQVFDSLSPAVESAIKTQEKAANTRNLIALVFIGSYLTLLLLMIILSAFFDLKEQATKDYLFAIGTPLGFIIGFYFKSSSK